MTKIALDLDGILIGLPPLVPKGVIDFFYKDQSKKELTYRFPCFWEQKIRQLSHLPGVRPAIKKNCCLIKSLSKSKKYRFYIISSRFSFLEGLTYKWLEKYSLRSCFSAIYLNTRNLQPHIFKEKMLEVIPVEKFIDDDLDTLLYLASKFKKIRFYWYTETKNKRSNTSNITVINNLGTILK